MPGDCSVKLDPGSRDCTVPKFYRESGAETHIMADRSRRDLTTYPEAAFPTEGRAVLPKTNRYLHLRVPRALSSNFQHGNECDSGRDTKSFLLAWPGLGDSGCCARSLRPTRS